MCITCNKKKIKKKKKKLQGACFIREQSEFYNSSNLFGLFVILASTLTSCQFANEPNCEISRGVLQNHGVCGQVFPLLPFHFFCSCSYIPAITGLEMLAMQATEVNVRLILISKDIPKLHPVISILKP